MYGGDSGADCGDFSALDYRGNEEADFVHKVAFESFAKGFSSALDEDAGDAMLAEFFKEFPERHAAENQSAVAVSVVQKLALITNHTTA